eukprot:5112627-Amphidinium_carterae.1
MSKEPKHSVVGCAGAGGACNSLDEKPQSLERVTLQCLTIEEQSTRTFTNKNRLNPTSYRTRSKRRIRPRCKFRTLSQITPCKFAQLTTKT